MLPNEIARFNFEQFLHHTSRKLQTRLVKHSFRDQPDEPWGLFMKFVNWLACVMQVGGGTRNRLSEIWGWPQLQNLALTELTVSDSPLPIWDIRH